MIRCACTYICTDNSTTHIGSYVQVTLDSLSPTCYLYTMAFRDRSLYVYRCHGPLLTCFNYTETKARSFLSPFLVPTSTMLCVQGSLLNVNTRTRKLPIYEVPLEFYVWNHAIPAILELEARCTDHSAYHIARGSWKHKSLLVDCRA